MSRLRKNTLIYTVGSALPRVGAFILLPVLTRYLTPAEYGTVNAMLILSSIATIMFTLALDRSFWRLYHDYSAEDRKDLLSTLMIALAVVATLGLGIALLGRGLLQLTFPTVAFFPYYVYALLAAYFAVFGAVPRIYLQVTGKAFAFALLALAEFVVTNALVLWFVMRGSGAAGMLEAQVIGAFAFGALYVGMATRIAGPVFRWEMLKTAVRFSAPLIPSLLFAWVLNLSDRLFLGRYRSLSEVGTYSAGYKIGSASTTLTGSFYQAYNPVFYRLAGQEDQVSARATISRYNKAFLAMTAFIGLSIAFLAPEVVLLVLPTAYRGITAVIQVVAFGYVVSQSQGLLELQIYQSKRTVGLMWVYASGAATNIVLNILLVPRFGSYAAAWTTTTAFVVMFTADYFYARRGDFIPFPWSEMAAWAVTAGVLLVTGAFVPLSHPIVSFAAKAGIIGVVFAAIEARYNILGIRQLARDATAGAS